MTRPPAAKEAAKEAVYGAVRDPLYRDVNRAVVGTVSWDVNRAVNGAVNWAVDRAVNGAVNGAVVDSSHPALQDFLHETEAET
jgi:hypothetical protein